MAEGTKAPGCKPGPHDGAVVQIHPDPRVHKPGCECLEFACPTGIRTHGCRCPLPGVVVRVYSFTNGMVAAFDAYGQQVPEYQGRLTEVEHRIRAHFPDAEWMEPFDFAAAAARLRERVAAVGASPGVDVQVSVTCPACGMTSSNPYDVVNGYCGNCHEFTGEQWAR